jgi:uncharacterized protein (UPF0548 family)
MFLASRPSPRTIDAFLETSSALPLSYEPVGLARHEAAGFRHDRHDAVVGQGRDAFERASALLAAWKQFDLGWIEVFPTRAPLRTGMVVAVLARHFGFWSLNGCRIVYTIETENDFGFAYGTLTNHAESGEEIFQVSLDPGTGSVSYLIRATSRPRAPMARLGSPIARSLQARFRRDSAVALARAIQY